jgi:hypothetical protein
VKLRYTCIGPRECTMCSSEGRHASQKATRMAVSPSQPYSLPAPQLSAHQTRRQSQQLRWLCTQVLRLLRPEAAGVPALYKRARLLLSGNLSHSIQVRRFTSQPQHAHLPRLHSLTSAAPARAHCRTAPSVHGLPANGSTKARGPQNVGSRQRRSGEGCSHRGIL